VVRNKKFWISAALPFFLMVFGASIIGRSFWTHPDLTRVLWYAVAALLPGVLLAFIGPARDQLAAGEPLGFGQGVRSWWRALGYTLVIGSLWTGGLVLMAHGIHAATALSHRWVPAVLWPLGFTYLSMATAVAASERALAGRSLPEALVAGLGFPFWQAPRRRSGPGLARVTVAALGLALSPFLSHILGSMLGMSLMFLLGGFKLGWVLVPVIWAGVFGLVTGRMTTLWTAQYLTYRACLQLPEGEP
jgi:hypothetical protein